MSCRFKHRCPIARSFVSNDLSYDGRTRTGPDLGRRSNAARPPNQAFFKRPTTRPAIRTTYSKAPQKRTNAMCTWHHCCHSVKTISLRSYSRVGVFWPPSNYIMLIGRWQGKEGREGRRRRHFKVGSILNSFSLRSACRRPSSLLHTYDTRWLENTWRLLTRPPLAKSKPSSTHRRRTKSEKLEPQEQTRGLPKKRVVFYARSSTYETP